MEKGKYNILNFKLYYIIQGNNMDFKDFKMDNLRQIREKKGFTQTKLSVDIEVSQELISHYETGKSKPNIETLIKLAEYFNCSTDYLLERTNNPSTVKDLNTKDIEINNIIDKYNSLSAENKKQFSNYLDYLSNQ